MTNLIVPVLSRVSYKDWELRVEQDNGGRWFLQWRFFGECVVTGNIELQSCRKHYLSEHMTETELVQTAFAAALQAEEHECREFFKYGNARPFQPHTNIRALIHASVNTDRRS